LRSTGVSGRSAFSGWRSVLLSDWSNMTLMRSSHIERKARNHDPFGP
jgi:hypothetical protein